MSRVIAYHEALREALALCLEHDPRVYLMGLGVPDPKGLFGSTTGLVDRFGPERVRDMPASENAMTGVALGSALAGMRPVLSHQRVDFALLAMEQMVNQVAKWHYMFGGQRPVPMLIRMIVGRGWGQGAQHSQSLLSWFAHVPGLTVIAPATPHDAKALTLAAIESDDPVISFEHRWCFNVKGEVPEGIVRAPLGEAHVVREGADVTIVASSYMVLEAMRAAEQLAEDGVDAEVIDLRTVAPLDRETLARSVRKTGHLVAADIGWTSFGVGAEVVSAVVEDAFDAMRSAPRRVASPDVPSPSTPALSAGFWPRARAIVDAARAQLGRAPLPAEGPPPSPLDVPDPTFTGPF